MLTLPSSRFRVRRRRTTAARLAVLCALGLRALAPSPADAQTSSSGVPVPPTASATADGAVSAPGAPRDTTGGRVLDAETRDATREELTRLLQAAERQAGAPTATPAARTRAREDAKRITARLTEGDLRPGDRLLLTVTLDSLRREEVVVRDGPALELGALPALSLTGLLRSEVQGAVLAHLRRFYRAPEVRVDEVYRLNFVGGVGRPGPVSVPPDMPLVDAIAAAGGMVQTAKSNNVTVLREGRRVLDGKRFQQALRRGETVAAAGIRSGDEVSVPIANASNNKWMYAQIAFFGLGILLSVAALVRATYGY